MTDTTELQQGSDDWFEARIGRITASNVGAILGLSPFRNRDDVMRSMVREYCGALSEFVGNVATEYGVMNEPVARADYQMQTGKIVETTGFHLASFDDGKWGWLGASPDGFVYGGKEITDRKPVEFKCPFSLRNGGKFKSIDEQPHYYAQIQVQMFVIGDVLECDFVQWHRDGLMIEPVSYDEEWLNEKLPKLREFYEEYLIEREVPNNEKHLKSRHAEINDDLMNQKVWHYFELKEQVKALNERADELLKEIIADCGESESQIGSYKLTRVSRKSIQYKNALAELLPADVDLTPYELVSTFWTLK